MSQRQRVVEHECGHAAMRLTLGLDVNRIKVFPARWSFGGHANFVHILDDMDEEKARRAAIAILAGPGLDDDLELPTWPVSKHVKGDEAMLAAFTKRAGIDSARAYGSLIVEMWELSTSERFDLLFKTLCMFMEADAVAVSGGPRRRTEDARRA